MTEDTRSQGARHLVNGVEIDRIIILEGERRKQDPRDPLVLHDSRGGYRKWHVYCVKDLKEEDLRSMWAKLSKKGLELGITRQSSERHAAGKDPKV